MGYSVEEILGWYRPGGLAEVRQGGFTVPSSDDKLSHTVVHELSHHDLVTNTLFGTVLRFVVEAKLKQQASVLATTGGEWAQVETGGLLNKLHNDAWGCLEGLACFEEYCTLQIYHIREPDKHGVVKWRRFNRRLPQDYRLALQSFAPLRLASVEKKFKTSDPAPRRQLALSVVIFQQVAARAIAEMVLDLPFLVRKTPTEIEAAVGRLVTTGNGEERRRVVIEQLSRYLAENMQRCYEKYGLVPLNQLADLGSLERHNTLMAVSEAIKTDIASGTGLMDDLADPSLLQSRSLTEAKSRLLRSMLRHEFFAKVDVTDKGDRDRLLIEELNQFYAQEFGDEAMAGAPIRHNAAVLQKEPVEPTGVDTDGLRAWLARMQSPEGGGGSGRFVGQGLMIDGEISVHLAFQQILRTKVSDQLHIKPHMLDDRVEYLGDTETLQQALSGLDIIWVHGLLDALFFRPDQYWSFLPLELPGRHYLYSQVFSSGHLAAAKQRLLKLSGDAAMNAEQCEFGQGENLVTVLSLHAQSAPALSYLFTYPGPVNDIEQYQGDVFTDLQEDTDDIIAAGLVAQKMILS